MRTGAGRSGTTASQLSMRNCSAAASTFSGWAAPVPARSWSSVERAGVISIPFLVALVLPCLAAQRGSPLRLRSCRGAQLKPSSGGLGVLVAAPVAGEGIHELQAAPALALGAWGADQGHGIRATVNRHELAGKQDRAVGTQSHASPSMRATNARLAA